MHIELPSYTNWTRRAVYLGSVAKSPGKDFRDGAVVPFERMKMN